MTPSALKCSILLLSEENILTLLKIGDLFLRDGISKAREWPLNDHDIRDIFATMIC